MKKYYLIVTGIALSVIAFIAWKVTITNTALHVDYLNIMLLDADKEVKSDAKHKDGAYNFVYYLSMDRIIATRSTWLGKISSDRIERKQPKYKNSRETGEVYMMKYYPAPEP